MIKLLEPAIDIKVRQQDVSIAKKMAKQAETKFAEVMAKNCTHRADGQVFTCEIVISEDSFLDDKTCGGIEIYALGGRIVVSNTLSDRLQHCYENLLPQIRSKLFPTKVI